MDTFCGCGCGLCLVLVTTVKYGLILLSFKRVLMRIFLQSTHLLVLYDLRRFWYKCGGVLMTVISLKTTNPSSDVADYSVETVAIN